MTWTLQRIGESKLFATFEQVFERDVQGVKEKKGYHHILSTK
jgi:hypothetical protein